MYYTLQGLECMKGPLNLWCYAKGMCFICLGLALNTYICRVVKIFSIRSNHGVIIKASDQMKLPITCGEISNCNVALKSYRVEYTKFYRHI